MVISVVGARPNFMKMVPVISALNKLNLPKLLVHTGQHYDENMSKVFFDDFDNQNVMNYDASGYGKLADIIIGKGIEEGFIDEDDLD